MRDEDDRLARAAQHPDDVVQPLDLGRGQAGRRLVEDDEVGLAGERAEDLDLLLLGQRQTADDARARELEAGVGDEPLEARAGAPGAR